MHDHRLGLWEFTLAGACCFEVETAHAKPQFSVFGHCYNKILWLLVLKYGFAVLWFRISSLPVTHRSQKFVVLTNLTVLSQEFITTRVCNSHNNGFNTRHLDRMT